MLRKHLRELGKTGPNSKLSKCVNFNKPCNFKNTFFKTDALNLVDVANNIVGAKRK